jgi:hypothetical protein
MVHSAVAESGESAYLVAHSDYSPQAMAGGADAILDEAVRDAVAAIAGQTQSQEEIKVLGHPGREVRFEGRDEGGALSAHSRIFLVDNRMYQLLWLGPRGAEKPAEVQHFFDSFRLDGAVANRQPDPAAPARQSANPVSSPPQLSKREREQIYRSAMALQKAVESVRQQLDQAQRVGANTEYWSQQLDGLLKQQERSLEFICRQRNLTRQQLDEIIAEGDANKWIKG